MKNAAAEAAYQQGLIAEDVIHYAEAVEHCEKAVRLAPKNTLYLNKAGEVNYTLANYQEAIEYFELALSSDLKTVGEDHPDVAVRRNNLGSAWKVSKSYWVL